MADAGLPDTPDPEDRGETGDVNLEISLAESDPNIPKIYFNNVAGAGSAADFAVLLYRKDAPQALIYMPLLTAKLLVESLAGILNKMEGDSHDENNEENLKV